MRDILDLWEEKHDEIFEELTGIDFLEKPLRMKSLQVLLLARVINNMAAKRMMIWPLYL